MEYLSARQCLDAIFDSEISDKFATIYEAARYGLKSCSAEDVAAARYMEENLPEHAVFLTGRQHLNPVSSLAGRTIVCGPDLWLHYHGLDTSRRNTDIAMFYQDPENNADVLEEYGVEYILVSNWERNDYYVDEAAIEKLYPIIFESEYGSLTIYDVSGGAANEQ